MKDTVRFQAIIKAREDEQRRFWGRGYIHTTPNGPVEDWSGDIIDTPETQTELEEAFYGFVKDYRSGDAGHELFDAAVLIEGFVVTKEKIAAGFFPEGMDEGIYVGFEARDTDIGEVLWEGVKSGRYKALSIVGSGSREPL
jgi:hypothetical protein